MLHNMICDKHPFNTLSEAATAAKGRSHAKRSKHGYKPYKCLECGLYHLTSKTKKLKHSISNIPPGTHVIGTAKGKYQGKQPMTEINRTVFTMTHKLKLPIELINQFK